MSQFDVYTNPIAEQRRRIPYWLDVQSNFLQRLESRVVVPLVRVTDKTALIERLNPTFEVEGTVVYADTSNMAAFPFRLLKQPVSSLRHEGFQVLAAFDFLVSGV